MSAYQLFDGLQGVGAGILRSTGRQDLGSLIRAFFISPVRERDERLLIFLPTLLLDCRHALLLRSRVSPFFAILPSSFRAQS